MIVKRRNINSIPDGMFVSSTINSSRYSCNMHSQTWTDLSQTGGVFKLFSCTHVVPLDLYTRVQPSAGTLLHDIRFLWPLAMHHLNRSCFCWTFSRGRLTCLRTLRCALPPRWYRGTLLFLLLRINRQARRIIPQALRASVCEWSITHIVLFTL